MQIVPNSQRVQSKLALPLSFPQVSPPANDHFDFHTIRKTGAWKRQRVISVQTANQLRIKNRSALSATLAWISCTSPGFENVGTFPYLGHR